MRRFRERRELRRRSLIAVMASLAVHGAFFTLVFALPSAPMSREKILAISLSGGIGGGSSAGAMDRRETAEPAAGPPAARLPKASVPRTADRKEPAAAEAKGAEAAAAGVGPAEPSAAGDGAPPADPSADGDAVDSGSGRGASGSAAVEAGGGAAAAADPLAAFTALVLAAVEANKDYPEAAKRRGTEGTVRLRLSVAEDGSLLSSRIDASSGSPLLDRAALDLLASAFPLDNAAHRRFEDLRISIHYGLRR